MHRFAREGQKSHREQEREVYQGTRKETAGKKAILLALRNFSAQFYGAEKGKAAAAL